MKWRDFYNLDIRLSKDFAVQDRRVGIFMDVTNVLNLRHLYRGSAFVGEGDYRDYMMSLHVPEEAFEELGQDPYAFIPGDDQPGDFRKPGVEFVPIEIVSSLEDNVQNPSERALYYEAPEDPADGTYYQWNGSSWQEADQGYVDQVLEDKSYIDMPNLRSFWFLNPREITFGFRYTF